jgi:hypothetical protein
LHDTGSPKAEARADGKAGVAVSRRAALASRQVHV